MVVAYTEDRSTRTRSTPQLDAILSAQRRRNRAHRPESRAGRLSHAAHVRARRAHYSSRACAALCSRTRRRRNIRPNAAELAALLAAGELDYIYDYQSVAESNGFRFMQLPPEIDLGDPNARRRVRECVGRRAGARRRARRRRSKASRFSTARRSPRRAARGGRAKLYRYLTSPAVDRAAARGTHRHARTPGRRRHRSAARRFMAADGRPLSRRVDPIEVARAAPSFARSRIGRRRAVIVALSALHSRSGRRPRRAGGARGIAALASRRGAARIAPAHRRSRRRSPHSSA